jgi:hypothetical protein
VEKALGLTSADRIAEFKNRIQTREAGIVGIG